ncbi:MAG: hypothetical protein ACOYJ2_08800 [Rickettsiales bacterium]
MTTPLAVPQESREFKWSDYITITDSNPLNRAKFVVMLDRIASTEDGRELIRKAREISGSIELSSDSSQLSLAGEPLQAVVTELYRKGGALVMQNPEGRYEGKLVVPVDQPEAMMRWTAPDGSEHVESHTGTLVHELFHLADPNHLPHVRLARCREAMVEEIASRLQIDGADDATKARVAGYVAEKIL